MKKSPGSGGNQTRYRGSPTCTLVTILTTLS